MIGLTRRDASALQRTVSHRKLHWLPGKAAGAEYAEFDGQEYLVDAQRIRDPGRWSSRPGSFSSPSMRSPPTIVAFR